MNRTENLLKSLSTWLSFAEISEIIIVDWSSNVEVSNSLTNASISDKRIRILRVDGETRWILSYAFNLGFRHAHFEQILKVDADIILRSDFFRKNHLKKGSYIAGNWEFADKGQEHINGFFYAFREDLFKVAGFNEYITSYGWDDDDIYERLNGIGLRRVCVDTKSIYHIPHDDVQRLDTSDSEQMYATDQLHRNPLFNIRANRFLAKIMPTWNQKRKLAPFEVLSDQESSLRLRRIIDQMPHYVSEDIKEDSEYYAALELVSWRLGPQIYHIPKDNFLKLLSMKQLEEISSFDIDAAIIGGNIFANLAQCNLILEIPMANVEDKRITRLLQIVSSQIGTNTALFLFCSSASVCTLIQQILGSRVILLDKPLSIKGSLTVVPADIGQFSLLFNKCNGLHITANNYILDAVEKLPSSSSSLSKVIMRRPKLYIDAQHGLGNRLRAIGSAASIAAATGREVVIVWEPNHHCNCRFTDLFEYSVAVIEQSFLEEARGHGHKIYNYMPIEAGSEKDALIDVDTNADIYARSAFVLNNPHSTWVSENQFLQSLVPTETVRELVDSVRNPNDVSAHVRMEAGPGLDQNSYDRPDNWREKDHDLIHYWRDKSHFSRFMRRIDTLITTGKAERIFIAADLPETYTEFLNRYPDRLAWLKRGLYDRSTEQLRYALADAILLGKSPLLLGSTWSSFTELATRLSITISKTEMSGTDF